jgi:hypothetical protein
MSMGMPPLGGSVESRPHAPVQPRIVVVKAARGNAGLVVGLLAAGALAGALVVYLVMMRRPEPDAVPPPPVIAPPAAPVVPNEAALSPDEVEDAVAKGQFLVQRCYQLSYKKQPALAKDISRLGVTIDVDPAGHVTRADIPIATEDDGGLGGCLDRVIRGWRFRATTRGGTYRFGVAFAGAQADSCDEVSCVLNDYEGACCAKLTKARVAHEPQAAPDGLPDGLDRDLISTAVGAVRPRVTACGDKSSAKGTVKVHVRVAPTGAIAAVTVETTPDPALGSCVAGVMQQLAFPKTHNGGAFGYPFIF